MDTCEIIVITVIAAVVLAICVAGIKADREIKARIKNSRYGNGYRRRNENS